MMNVGYVVEYSFPSLKTAFLRGGGRKLARPLGEVNIGNWNSKLPTGLKKINKKKPFRFGKAFKGMFGN